MSTSVHSAVSNSIGAGGSNTYESPVKTICMEVRRKNIAAAWSSPSSFTISSDDATLTSSDPWDDYHDSFVDIAVLSRNEHIDTASLISFIETNKRNPRKRGLGRSSPKRGTTLPSTDDIGPNRLESSLFDQTRVDFPSHSSVGLAPYFYPPRTSLKSSAQLRTPTIAEASVNEEDPQHAKNLLETAPHLRVIAPQSTDMNGSGDVSGQQSLFHRVWLAGSPESSNPHASSAGVSGVAGITSQSSTHGPALVQQLSSFSRISKRDRENQRAANELASLLWTLAHEMSPEDFGYVESQVFTAVFGLVHDCNDQERRLAGLTAVHALLAAPSVDEEKKSIKFANTLSQALRTAGGDFEFLSSVTSALGKMARRPANVDLVESEVTRALEWLRTDRSDRRLAACLALREFAIHAPTTFHSKTSQQTVGQGGSNAFLDHIFEAIRDKQPIVRACAADALSQCLKILVDRHHLSLTGLLCQVHFALMEGLNEDSSQKRGWKAVTEAEASQHGSLLVVSTMLAYTGDFVLPRYNELCQGVMNFCTSSKALIRLEVIRLLPRLAQRRPRVFGRHFLEKSLVFLVESASTIATTRSGVDVRPTAFKAIGQLVLAMTDDETGNLIGGTHLPTLKISDDPEQSGRKMVELSQGGITHEKLGEIFDILRSGIGNTSITVSAALYCASNLVEALGDSAIPYLKDLIDKMFQAGLSVDLIKCLHVIAQFIPTMQNDIEDRMLQEVSLSLAGIRNFFSFCLGNSSTRALVAVNWGSDPGTVHRLVLSLRTLASFGGRVSNGSTVVPLLPFLNDVVAKYMKHPSAEVRRAACLTCCMLLIPAPTKKIWGGYSGMIIEEVLGALVQVAVSDPTGGVRLCVVQAFDSRYDLFLAQSHHLARLFILLQDESLSTRAAGLRLLGRLSSMNPAIILPVLRIFLENLITELNCGVDTGRGREEATRLLVVFLRAKALQRLVHPVLAHLITALPLDASAPPRLAAASLEALGDLALATGVALKPWVHKIIPHVLKIMLDNSSASKQRTSLRTLGQIAGSTGYVMPYLEYPRLLSQATDILPATKRAPWSLRREVIRTLGILGALDPDRYFSIASRTRKRGAVGGAYFEETDHTDLATEHTSAGYDNSMRKLAIPDNPRISGAAEEDKPAYLFMYEQYAMIAQPVSNLRPARKMTPIDEEFYPTVAIQALMRIFRDPSLTVHHGTVAQAIMFIFKSLGLGCVPYLETVVPHITTTLRNCPSTLRESLLKQLSTLSLIVREHLRPYVADIFEITEDLWNSKHLSTIFGLISNIAVGVPGEFKHFVRRFVKKILVTLDELQVADWGESSSSNQGEQYEKLSLILTNLGGLRSVLSDYLHILVPALLKLVDSLASILASNDSRLSMSDLLHLSVLTYRTVSHLLESLYVPTNALSGSFFPLKSPKTDHTYERGLPARVVHPIIRVLKEKPPSDISVVSAMVETLCVCIKLIGLSNWLAVYDSVVREAVTEWISIFAASARENQVTSLGIDVWSVLHMYDGVIDELGNSVGPRNFIHIADRSGSLVAVEGENNLARENGVDMTSPLHLSQNSSTTRRVNQTNLQRAWDVSQRSSMDDWDEWMRRLAIELLRQAPSPALRACASLAQAYQPLSRELFSAAFCCCWGDLAEAYRLNLVHALETAFVSNVSPEILQALLNLAEFMEHEPTGGLPIDIGILANLALKCRAYAKALHYKEREYRQGATGETTAQAYASVAESLISINRKLDLQDAALGILKVSSLGEALVSDVYVGEELSTKFAKQQTYDMCYSVMCNVEGKNENRDGLDITAKQELWLAKLGSWAEALAVYERKLERDSNNFEAVLGCMRCLDASGEWRKVLELGEQNWEALSGRAGDKRGDEWASPRGQRKAMRMCAHAAWRLGKWEDLERFASELVKGGNEISAGLSGTSMLVADTTKTQVEFDGAFYSAVSFIHGRQWAKAADAIDAARKAMDGRLTALLAESYNRAYPSMVTAQCVAEMEEIIELRKVEERSIQGSHLHPANRPSHLDARQRLLAVWRDRLAGCRRDAEVHSAILSVRSLVLGPEDDIDSILTLSELSRQAQRHKFAEWVLLDPLQAMNADINGPAFGLSDSIDLGLDFGRLRESSHSPVIERILQGDLIASISNYGPQHEHLSKSIVADAGGLVKLATQYQLYDAFVRHLWYTHRREEALTRLSRFCSVVDMVSHCGSLEETQLLSRCWVELGEWKIATKLSPNSYIPEELQIEVLAAYKRATSLNDCGYKAWHAWALLNFRIALQSSEGDHSPQKFHSSVPTRLSERTLRNHVVAAVEGFVNAISLGTIRWSASVQQDLLNLLTCLFRFAGVQDVAKVINASIGNIAIEAWLGILPQLLARIHIKQPAVRSVLHPLLVKLGQAHAQAFIYPLSVLLKSPVAERKSAAQSLMNSLRAHSSELVNEALLVSAELIRVAILWLETWHEGLEDASRLYFGDGNFSAMLELLLPLHSNLERGAETQRENEFLSVFGQDLAKAHFHIREYLRLTEAPGITDQRYESAEHARLRQNEEAETAINKAWDIYYTVFRRINKQLPSLTKLELSQCSPALSGATNLELGVPGSYRVDGSYVKIHKFVPKVHVITSKQRPRKITLRGSDGKDYVYLLKGHEDLRQDERVMQLFGLVNALLARDPQTKKHDLNIQRYAIAPLSHNCGLVGWVPHTDTFHSLIRDYRQSKGIPLNSENREMLKIAPDYELLTVMQKVEVFTQALKNTIGSGDDLYEILWLKSTNSEEWLERRTTFTRSLAVMSMVGYILGLGDRHPSNLLLDEVSGRVLHIDFGDCFEVAKNRDKFPEKVPFRLTRMLIKAMEVSGIEGSYRSTCERTMTVLRDSRDSLVAMLEAFVYDPLISWRLADVSANDSHTFSVSTSSTRRRGAGGSRQSGVGGPSSSAAPVSRQMGGPSGPPILEEDDENDPSGRDGGGGQDDGLAIGGPRSRARSMQIFADIQTLAANVVLDDRISSIAGGGQTAGGRSESSAFEGSLARSRMERSMLQREVMSLLDGEDAATHEGALNEKALKVIRRVQDKLTGTDFPDSRDGEDPLVVQDQVQRLIIQATSSENLCQLFIGWCAFW